MITVALAEDHSITLKRFAGYFKNKEGLKVVIEAVNGYDLILKINALQQLPDIVLLDINMPIMDGVAVCYYLKVHYPEIKVVALSNYIDEGSLKKVFSLRADGYVMKAMAENVLPEALYKILKNEPFIDHRIDLNQEQIQNILSQQKRSQNNYFELTDREKTFIILNATALHYKQIAELMCVEPKTIETYYNRISKKLNLHSRQALTIFSLQNGLAAIAQYN